MGKASHDLTPRQKAFCRLTPRQKAFCREFIVDRCGRRAAIRAGYSARTATAKGSHLMRTPHVRAEIDRLDALTARRSEITLDRIMAELAKIGFANVDDFLARDPQTRTWTMSADPARLDRDRLAAVQEITVHKDGRATVKLHDKQRALVALGTHLGGFARRREALEDEAAGAGAPDPVTSIGVMEACRRIAFALSRGARLQDAEAQAIEHGEAAT
jgi:phage terminase small subunit